MVSIFARQATPQVAMFRHRFLLSFVAFILLLGGCQQLLVSTDTLIAQVVRGGMSVRDQVIRQSNGIIADYQVYRDNEADGVVFKFVYAADVEIDRSMVTPESIKKEMLANIRGDKDQAKILELGIYLKFIYITSSGEVIAQTKITSDDL